MPPEASDDLTCMTIDQMITMADHERTVTAPAIGDTKRGLEVMADLIRDTHNRYQRDVDAAADAWRDETGNVVVGRAREGVGWTQQMETNIRDTAATIAGLPPAIEATHAALQSTAQALAFDIEEIYHLAQTAYGIFMDIPARQTEATTTRTDQARHYMEQLATQFAETTRELNRHITQGITDHWPGPLADPAQS